MTATRDFELHVHGYNDTLFAARPEWAHAAVVMVDTYEGPHVDWHGIRAAIYGGSLAFDPFAHPFWFAAEAEARRAADLAGGREDAIDAANSLRRSSDHSKRRASRG